MLRAAAVAGLSQAKQDTLATVRANLNRELPVQYLATNRSDADWVALREALANDRQSTARQVLGSDMPSAAAGRQHGPCHEHFQPEPCKPTSRRRDHRIRRGGEGWIAAPGAEYRLRVGTCFCWLGHAICICSRRPEKCTDPRRRLSRKITADAWSASRHHQHSGSRPSPRPFTEVVLQEGKGGVNATRVCRRGHHQCDRLNYMPS